MADGKKKAGNDNAKEPKSESNGGSHSEGNKLYHDAVSGDHGHAASKTTKAQVGGGGDQHKSAGGAGNTTDSGAAGHKSAALSPKEQPHAKDINTQKANVEKLDGAGRPSHTDAAQKFKSITSFIESAEKKAEVLVHRVKETVSAELSPVKHELQTAGKGVNSFIEKLKSNHDGDKSKEAQEKQQPVKEQHDKTAPKIEHPEKLPPEKRAAAGVTDYVDPNSQKHYQFDKQGRLMDLTSSNGRHAHFEYKDDKSEHPKSFWLEQPTPGGAVARHQADDKTQIKLDQHSGEVIVSNFDQHHIMVNGRPVEKAVHVENHYSSDGTQTVLTRDGKDNHPLSKDIVVPEATGARHVAHIDYYYHNANGQPSDKPDPKGPVLAVERDEQGRLAHQYQFADGKHFDAQKPSIREDVKYTIDGDLKKEHHAVYDLSNGKSVLALSTDKTTNGTTGDTNVHKQTYNDGKTVVDQEMTFDKTGKATEFKMKDSANHLDVAFKLDDKGQQIVGVSDSQRQLSAAETKAILGQANFDLSSARANYMGDSTNPARVGGDFGPTPPRQGTDANGTLVWKDGESFSQGKVKDGVVYDSHDKAIGKLNDSGDVTLDGPPPSKFNVGTRDGAAFHGVGSDHDRLDLCSGQNANPDLRHEGFNGVFTNGTDKFVSLGGNLFDKEGEFIGHVDNGGQVSFDKNDAVNKESKPINSFLGDGSWHFEGNESGKVRNFDINQNMSKGDLYLADTDQNTHKPKLDEQGKELPPVHYEIRMGMIINPKTGEELGKFIPPSEVKGSDSLQGGFIVTGDPPRPVALTNFTKAVFDVESIGGSGDAGRHIRGVSLGPETQADGTCVPGKGGIVNLNNAVDVQEANLKTQQADLQAKQDSDHWYKGSFFSDAGAQAHSAQTAVELATRQRDDVNGEVQKIVSTGQVDDALIARLGRQTSTLETAALGDGLERQRKQLDNPPHLLEHLPQDVSKIDGSVKVPDKHSSTGVADYDIRQGNIYHKGSNDAVGSINSADGSINWANEKGTLERKQMSDLKGAVWHLEYPDEKGQHQKVDWITGADHRIYSVAELKQQAANETAYARNFDGQNHNEMSQKALERSQASEARYDKKLDDIVKNGIPADAKDDSRTSDRKLFEFTKSIVEEPQKNVRAELFREKEPPPPKIISVPDLTKDKIEKGSGSMRVSNDQYDIDHGKVFRVQIDAAGHRVREKDSCGTLGENYVLKFNDSREISLANQDRVILKLKFDGEDKEHRILGMGPPRIGNDGQPIQGGLVEADELLRQSKEAQSQALKGNLDYFNNMPMLIGGTSDRIMGDRGAVLQQVTDSISKQTQGLNREFDQLFTEGLSGKPIDNNQIDHNIRATQHFMKDMNLSAQDATELSQKGQEMQKQAADAAAMATVTVLTAGAGAYLSTLSLGRVAMVGTELGVGTVSGALSSVAFRQTFGGGQKQLMENIDSGAIEGFTMAAGSAGGKLFSEFAAASKLAAAGKVLTPAQEALLSSPAAKSLVGFMERNETCAILAERGMTLAYKSTNAFVQSTGFSVAGGIREGNLNEVMSAKNLLQGTAWMLAGEAAGSALHLTAGIGAEFKPTSEAGHYLDTFIKNVPTDVTNAFTNSALSAIAPAYENERTRIAEQLHVNRDAVSDEMLSKHINYSNVYSYMFQSGIEGAATAPFMTAISAPVHNLSERLNEARNVHDDEPQQRQLETNVAWQEEEHHSAGSPQQQQQQTADGATPQEQKQPVDGATQLEQKQPVDGTTQHERETPIEGATQHEPPQPLDSTAQRRQELSESLSKNAHDSVQRGRLEDYLHKFESRGDLSTQEKERVYMQLSALLDAPATNPVNQYTRTHTAEQILRNISDPLSITQGKHNTCNVATQEARMCLQDPAKYVHFITEIALNGKFTTRDGTVIVVSPDISKKDLEARAHWVATMARFSPVDGVIGLLTAHEFYKQMPFMMVDPERNLASQIFQVGAANVFAQRQTRILGDYGWVEGERGSFHYRQETPDSALQKQGIADTGERLVYTDKSGTEHVIAREPKPWSSDLDDVFSAITGRLDDGTVFQPYTVNGQIIPGKTFETKDQLTQLLLEQNEKCKSEGRPFCTTIQVDTFHEPFFTDSGAGKAGGSGGAHVVNVIGIKPDGKGGYLVEVDNSWQRGAEHHGANAISLDDLFMASSKRESADVISTLRQRAAEDPDNLKLQVDLLRHEYNRSELLRSALANDPTLSNPATLELMGSRMISFGEYNHILTELTESHEDECRRTLPPGEFLRETRKFKELVNGLIVAAGRAQGAR